MSTNPFDVLNTGTGTLLKNNATRDGHGAPEANYDVLRSGIPCQRDPRLTKLMGNEKYPWDQAVVEGGYGVWISDEYPEVPALRKARGNGYAWRFDDDQEFGRILDCEPDKELAMMPGSILFVVEVVGS